MRVVSVLFFLLGIHRHVALDIDAGKVSARMDEPTTKVDNYRRALQTQPNYYIWPAGSTNECPEGTSVPQDECFDVAQGLIANSDFQSMTSSSTSLGVNDWNYTPCGCFLWVDSRYNSFYTNFDTSTTGCNADGRGHSICTVPMPTPSPIASPIQPNLYLWSAGSVSECPEGASVPQEDCWAAAHFLVKNSDYFQPRVSESSSLEVNDWNYTPCGCFLWEYGGGSNRFFTNFDTSTTGCRADYRGHQICTVPMHPGRCGPLFDGQVCECPGGYCNTETGFCGDTSAHKNAQFGEEYDCRTNDGQDHVNLLQPGRGINCVGGYDINKEDCIAAAQSVGGQLREGRFLVGDWENSPNGCFIESSDKAIHYNRNSNGANNGYFQSVCAAAEDEVTVLDAYKGSECGPGHSYSKEECADAASAIGGVLVNGAMKVGEWSHIPYGCAIQESDNVIHFGTNIEGTNAGQFQPVCVAGTDKAIMMPAREGSSCEMGYDFNEDECVDAALSIGGKLRDGKVIVGAWANSPNACFVENMAIHYNTNQQGINNGSFNSICKVGIIKATMLPAYQGTACAPADAIAIEDCVASAAAIGGKLRDGNMKIGEFGDAPPGCFVEATDKAIHFNTGAGYNVGSYQPVCVAGAIEATVLPNFEGTSCTPGFDFTEQECIEAATAIGGILRNNKFIVGDWANTPNACFIEARDRAIHYGHNQGARNNGYFHPVCKPAAFEVNLMPAGRGAKCRENHDFTEQECITAAKSVGGQLRNNAYLVGDWTNGPFGCFLDQVDQAIHYGRDVNGNNAGNFQPVCKVAGDEASRLPATRGSKCATNYDFSQEDCIAAAESVGGQLRDGKYLTGSWPYAPYGCFIEERDGAIHFGTNVASVNNGNYEPVCIYN